MTTPMRYPWMTLLLLAAAALVARGLESHAIEPPPSANPGKDSVEFNRDIRPILSNNCFKCHGPDDKARQAGLRLDLRELALLPTQVGGTPIIPGKPDDSGIVQRIFSTDPDFVMPPPSTNKRLTTSEKDLLRQWIAQGAEYQEHWSFIPPIKPALPKVNNPSWPRNAIDHFILARLEAEGLSPSPEADKLTLIRRVTLDLTGLPPTPAEVDAFLADSSSDAYESLVDRLLASPRYGERMAVEWLDAARFADTHGYHIDSARDMTHWREWVIGAFNRNMPFDRFTIDQIAGDLLPDATMEQRIASGFNRNHMINYEGGAIPEEYLAAYIVDRVNTTSTVWMGLTIACAQCHDHKYDPITQKEYYQLYAFFHNLPENGLDGRQGNAAPVLKFPTPEQQKLLEDLRGRVTAAKQALKQLEPQLVAEQAEWETASLKQLPSAPVTDGLLAHYELDGHTADTSGHYHHGQFRDAPPAYADGKIRSAAKFEGNGHIEVPDLCSLEATDQFSYGAWINPTDNAHKAVLARMDDVDTLRGYDLYWGDGKLFIHLVHKWPDNAIRVNTNQVLPPKKWYHVMVTYDGSGKAAGVKLYLNGKPQGLEVTHDSLSATIQSSKPLMIGRRSSGAVFHGLIDDVRVYQRELSAAEIEQLAVLHPIRVILEVAADKRTPEQNAALQSFYREQHAPPEYKRLQAELADSEQQTVELDKAIPTAMVMQEMEKPRDTFMLVRGQYDKRGERVSAGVPAVLSRIPDGAPANRLGLAQWLVNRSHPLTARVMVNRYWQMYFGTGLVKTAEDFGSQGEAPSHPELLDWLAAEFMDAGWNVKRLQRLIVTSATYRQSSVATPEWVARDPENRLLTRAPRLRLQAEFIRDQALAVSGLLNGDIGGRSVSPYQPAGLWEELAFRQDGKNFSAQSYEQSHGRELYRRTMYTFWKRTSPPPTLVTFDAPDRETCTVRRPRTNTPLQALVLMNDPTYVEASRKLAERMMKEGGSSVEDRITFAFRLATARRPKHGELAVLRKLFDEQVSVYRRDAQAALKLLAVGESGRDEQLDAVELAAWSMVASVILNLDETVTKG